MQSKVLAFKTIVSGEEEIELRKGILGAKNLTAKCIILLNYKIQTSLV